MSAVDAYFEWANATGDIILNWARPVGAPIGPTSVSQHQRLHMSCYAANKLTIHRLISPIILFPTDCPNQSFSFFNLVLASG